MFALLVALLAPPSPVQARPRLCLAAPSADLTSGRCMDVDDGAVTVDKETTQRAWIWMDAARTTIAVGTLPAEATKIVVDPKPAMAFTLDGSSDRGWPAPTTLVVGAWKFTLPP